MKRFASLSFMPRLGGRRASFKLGVIATLAITVGANIAVLGNLSVLMGQVVPGAAHQHILQPYLQPLNIKLGPAQDLGVPPPVYAELARRLKGRAALGLYENGNATLGNQTGGETIPYLQATPSLAEVFGLRPAAGRLLAPADSTAGAAPVAVISARLANRLYGGSQAAIGHYLTFPQAPGSPGGERYRIVGVLPANFAFPLKQAAQAWIPLPTSLLHNPGSGSFATFALVHPLPGLSTQAVSMAFTAAYHAALSQYPPQFQAMFSLFKPAPRVAPLAERLYGPVATRLELIEIAALLLALLVFVNLSGLATADALARRHEFALRGVLGARPMRLYLERLRELAGLALIGWAIGIGLGWLGRRALADALGQAGPAAALSLPVLGITFGCVLLFAVALAAAGSLLHAHKPTVLLSLLGTGTRSSGGRGLTRALRALIVLQLGVSVVLLVLAANLRVNVFTLSTQNLGFESQGRYFFEVALPQNVTPNSSGKAGEKQTMVAIKKRTDFEQQLLDRLDQTSGITAAGTLNGVLHWGGLTIINASKTRPPAKPGPNLGSSLAPVVQPVSHDSLKALGLSVIAGDPATVFTPSSKAVFIDTAFARKLWPHDDPEKAIGKSFYLASSPVRIAAVIKPIRMLPYEPPHGMVFTDYTGGFNGQPGTFAIVTRSRLPGHVLLPEIKRITHGLNPQATVYDFKSGAQIVASAYSDRNHLAQVFGALALVAVLISAVGLFALLAYRSLVRRQEFAIRAALGATRARLRLSVFREAFALWLIGAVIGIPVAYELARVLASTQPELGLPGAAIVIAVVVALLVIAVAAALVPAHRAAITDLSGNLSA